MNSTKRKIRLHAITVLIYLTVCAALPTLAAPASKTVSPTPAASLAASATPAAKARPFPFQNTVISVDKAARTFRMGKKTVHQVHVSPETKVIKDDGTPAMFEEIKVGMEVRGSTTKRADGDYEAVSLKLGPKAAATPVASPSPSPSPTKK